MADCTTDDGATAPEEQAPAVPEPERDHGALVTCSHGRKVLHPTREELPTLVPPLRAAWSARCLAVAALDYPAPPRDRGLHAGVAPTPYDGFASHPWRSHTRPTRHPATP